MRLKLQGNRFSIQAEPLQNRYSIPLPIQTNDPIAVSANPTRVYSQTTRSRRHEQPIPPIMKNVRYKPNNPTETRTIPARTQIAAPHSELGMNDSTGIQIPKLSQTRGSLHQPRRSGHPGVRRWSPEDGGEGLRRVLLLRPLVRRKATMKSTSAMRYPSLKKPIQTT